MTRAIDHHGDPICDTEHRVHVVFDQQDRVVCLSSPSRFSMRSVSFGAHARERLIEQQHPGLRGQAQGDLELALLTCDSSPA